jgi:S-adenosylmethionine:tRNA ribosyltransferase-isomerase
MKLTMQTKSISIDSFDYTLPENRIAKFPLPQRDNSKLLIYKDKQISETVFKNVSELIPENSLLIFNNTRVIQARLIFQKETGAFIEIFCLEPKDPAEYTESFRQNHACTWLCLVGNLKRWKSGKLSAYHNGTQCTVEKLQMEGETHLIRFEWDNSDWTFADVLENFGELPIPPYLNRKTEESDKTTYQTVYSKIQGSVAAPTAGLHFTESVLKDLQNKQILIEEVTLHVGAGTFKPVKTATLSGHEMHAEWISVHRSVIRQLIDYHEHILAVGTTSVRTLESLYYLGLKVAANPDLSPDNLTVGQWDPYSSDSEKLTTIESLQHLLAYMDRFHLKTLIASTQILIAPGYPFHIVNGMITNFHQPKSTLLLLISTFTDGHWREIYDYALAHDFRFLSYGDSSLLMR